MQNSLSISPNPCNEKIIIHFPFATETPSHIDIFNIFGELVHTSMIPENNEINTDTLPSGSYTVIVTNAKKSVIGRFEKGGRGVPRPYETY